MKTFYLLLSLIVLTSTALSATGNPEKSVTIIDAKTVTVTTSSADSELFIDAFYNEDKERFEFNTVEEINFVHVYNDSGQMELQLSTKSKKVKLGMSLFEKGVYRIGFLATGSNQIRFTNVTIK